MKLALLQPIYDSVPVAHYQSMLALTHASHDRALEMRHIIANASLVQLARTKALIQFHESGFEPDYLLWIDGDIVFTLDNVFCLLRDAAAYDILSARYLLKNSARRLVCAYRQVSGSHLRLALPGEATGVVEVDSVGLGFCVMKPRVVRVLIERHGYQLFETETLRSGDVVGEDVKFFDKARAAGFRIHVDLDNQVGHYGVVI